MLYSMIYILYVWCDSVMKLRLHFTVKKIEMARKKNCIFT